MGKVFAVGRGESLFYAEIASGDGFKIMLGRSENVDGRKDRLIDRRGAGSINAEFP